MKLLVKSYDSRLFYHLCKDEQGENHWVDLLVNGDFPKDTTPESLIGKTFEVQSLTPHHELAYNVNPKPIE